MAAQKQMNDLGRYEKLFQKGILNPNGTSKYVQTLIDLKLQMEGNAFFWQQHFVKDSMSIALPRDKKELPSYTVRNIVRTVPVMPDVHTPMSEVSQTDSDGWEQKQGTLQTFAFGIYETSYSKEELANQMLEMGGDAALLQQYVDSIAKKVLGINYLISFLSAQKLSTGGGTTVKGQSRIVKLPNILGAQNFKKAGVKVWTDPDCDILEQMRIIEDTHRDDNYDYMGMLRWDIDDVTIKQTMLKNKSVIDELKLYVAMYGMPNANVTLINGELPTTSHYDFTILEAYSRSEMSKVSPIYMAKENQNEQTLIGRNKVRGWDIGKAVLRPEGYAGVVKYSEIRDIRLLQSEAAPNVIVNTASLMGGMAWVANIVSPNGLLCQYHSNIYTAVQPELTEFVYHWIIDTTTAND